MATAKKKTPAKKRLKPQNPYERILQKGKSLIAAIKKRIQGLLARRPHRSFRRTRRRNYVRSLKLPGYWAFTIYVFKTLWARKGTYLLVIAGYAILTAFLVGVASQDTYTQLGQTIRDTGGDIFKGNWGNLAQAGLLVVTGAVGGYNDPLNQNQQVTTVVIALIIWLTIVWLLRSQLLGNKPKLRDGVYNAGAPIIPTLLVALVFIIQLFPVVLALLAFTTGAFTNGGVELMLFCTVALLLVGLSLYWTTSTFFALVIVTLPGMYPMKALRAAGDLVIGRRLRILLRIVWMLGSVIVLWALTMVPLVLIDTWIKGIWPAINWLPLVPFGYLLVGAVTITWVAGYVYLLYRKVVDDDAQPA